MRLSLETQSETTSLTGREVADGVHRHNSRFNLIVCIVVLTMAIVALSSYSSYDSSGTSTQTTLSSSTKSDPALWIIYNTNYDPLVQFTENQPIKYAMLENYNGVIEPGAPMGLYFRSAVKYVSSAFTVCSLSDSGEEEDCQTSATTLAINCTVQDDYSVRWTGTTSKGTEEEFQGHAKCLYVRREIRSLTEADLNKTLEAMYTSWVYSEEDGQALYGEDWHSHAYWVSAHYFASAARDGDYSHGGVGFLPQHVKLTNWFEKSMQAVDSTVSLPYWDYTIDAYGSVYDISIFTDNIFGSLNEPSTEYWTYANESLDLARIPNSRWKDTKVMMNTDYTTKNAEAISPYGYLRAPWSANPSPYLLRFPSGEEDNNGLPDCESYYNWFDTDTLFEHLAQADVGPHTMAHWTMGQMYGCDILDPLVDAGYVNKRGRLCLEWGIYMKALYRDYYIETNESCTPETCAWSCIEDRKDAMLTYMSSKWSSTFLHKTMDTADWEVVQDFICDGDGYKVFYGDHREPASPGDPSFWPIHPNLDRGFQAKSAAGFTSTDWKDSEKDHICGMTECYIDAVYGEWPSCCFGHYETDGFPDFINGNMSATVGYTNREIVDLSDPSTMSYNMPYMYDNFLWAHCANLTDGEYDVDALLESKIISERRVM